MGDAKKKKTDKAREYSFRECGKIKRPDGLVMYGVKKYTFRDFVEAVCARYSKLL